jgi:hypothetical protein
MNFTCFNCLVHYSPVSHIAPVSQTRLDCVGGRRLYARRLEVGPIKCIPKDCRIRGWRFSKSIQTLSRALSLDLISCEDLSNWLPVSECYKMRACRWQLIILRFLPERPLRRSTSSTKKFSFDDVNPATVDNILW